MIAKRTLVLRPSAVFDVSHHLHALTVCHTAMAEPNQEPTEPERFETQTDVSPTSIGDGQDVGPLDLNDNQVVNIGDDVGQVIPQPPAVYVEPPLTKTHPPIFYVPIPSPGDPLPLIPTKAFVVGPVAPIVPVPKSVFLSAHATQSTFADQQTGPKQLTPHASASAKDQTDSDVDIPAVHVRSHDSDADIPVMTPQPVVGKPVPSKPRGVAKSCFDVDSKTPVPAPGRVIWSSTDDVVPKSVFLTGRMEPLNPFPPVAFGGYTSAVPGSAPKSHSGWTSCGAQVPPAVIPHPCTGWLAPGIPKPPPPPLQQHAVHVAPPIGTPTPISGMGSGHSGSPFQTPSSVHLTTPRVIPEPKSLDVQSMLRPRVLFPNPTSPQPDPTMSVTGSAQQMQQTQPTITPDTQQTQSTDEVQSLRPRLLFQNPTSPTQPDSTMSVTSSVPQQMQQTRATIPPDIQQTQSTVERTGVRNFIRQSTPAASSNQVVVPNASEIPVDQGPIAPSSSDTLAERIQSDDPVYKHLSGAQTSPDFNSLMSNIQTAVNEQQEQERETQTETREPEGEPQVPPIRVPRAWNKMEGSIILIGGFSNAGKSSLVESITTAFGLKRWTGHPNKKVWISNESGQERNSMRHLLHYTNDSFRVGSTAEINHSGLNQSIFSMTGKFQHVVTFVEGHRIFDNEDLIEQAALFIWIHTPSQTRKVRSPASKAKSMDEWNVQLREEVAYFNRIKHLFQRFPFTILSGLQSKAFNTLVVMAMMGLFVKNIPRNQLLCYREFDLPNPEDTDADNQRLQTHSKHEPDQFSSIFRSKLYALKN